MKLQSEIITLKIDKPLLDRLKRDMKAEGLTRSAVIRRALLAYYRTRR